MTIALSDLRPAPGAPAEAWALRIRACWQASVHAIIEVGRLLIEAKAALPHGAFEPMIDAELPFGARTAQMLMAISADQRLTNPKHASLLPPSWTSMYELTKLGDEDFQARVSDGTIRPDVDRNEIKALVKAAKLAPVLAEQNARYEAGCSVDDLHKLAADGYQAATLLADPPWHFLTRSAKGQDRSPKYRTDPLADIKALPVHALTAPNSVCLIWCVDWYMPAALELLAAWGFEYKTIAFTWAKQNPSGEGWHMGQGYWTRANPEMCLLGTKGHPTRLHADVRQLLVAPVMEHSRKPDEAHARIERLLPGPYLELYGRRARQNWKVWGNEIPREAFEAAASLPPHDPVTGEIIEEEISPNASDPAACAAETPSEEITDGTLDQAADGSREAPPAPVTEAASGNSDLAIRDAREGGSRREEKPPAALAQIPSAQDDDLAPPSFLARVSMTQSEREIVKRIPTENLDRTEQAFIAHLRSDPDSFTESGRERLRGIAKREGLIGEGAV